jgi:hypothetical protein
VRLNARSSYSAVIFSLLWDVCFVGIAFYQFAGNASPVGCKVACVRSLRLFG